jgi:hypothetical protein
LSQNWEHASDFPPIDNDSEFRRQFETVMDSNEQFLDSLFETSIFSNADVSFSIKGQRCIRTVKKSKNLSIINGILVLAQLSPEDLRRLNILSIAQHELKSICRDRVADPKRSDLEGRKLKTENLVRKAEKEKVKTDGQILLFMSKKINEEEQAWIDFLTNRKTEQEWAWVYSKKFQ